MRKIILHMMISLDGYIEGPNKELDWHFVDEDFEIYSKEMLRSIGGILLGRNVYELFAEFWPDGIDNPASAPNPAKPEHHLEAAALLNSLPKYVVSTTLEKPGWNNTQIIRNNVAGTITELKQLPGKDIALFGGARLINSLMQLDLIDEYRVIVNPVLLGSGTPLFSEGYGRIDLKLTGIKKFKSGALILNYVPS
jgi:dihydrofolate reductase